CLPILNRDLGWSFLRLSLAVRIGFVEAVLTSSQERERHESGDEDANRSHCCKPVAEIHRLDSLGDLFSAGDSGVTGNRSPGSRGRWTASSSSPRAFCARASASSDALVL